jgi:hypothetical protein
MTPSADGQAAPSPAKVRCNCLHIGTTICLLEPSVAGLNIDQSYPADEGWSAIR